MFDEYPDILTTEAVSDLVRAGYNSVYELLNSGKLKGYRNGRVWRIPKESIKKYILDSANLSNK